MLFLLAIIPAVVLLVYIYKKDKREKEPLRLLLKCFIWGIIIVIPVIIMETALEFFADGIFEKGSVIYAAIEGFVVAGFTEELFKYTALKKCTWKSKEFNCSFDGIIYAVFVSLGFATFENIMYVLDGDISIAFLRMFTAVPGHAYDAVFMGYFYSKAKAASLKNDKAAEKKYKKRALLIPVLLHGIYDCLISFDEEVVGENVLLIGIVLWIMVVIIEFVAALNTVRKSSVYDTYFEAGDETEVKRFFIMKNGNWICNCKNINSTEICAVCGLHKPQ